MVGESFSEPRSAIPPDFGSNSIPLFPGKSPANVEDNYATDGTDSNTMYKSFLENGDHNRSEAEKHHVILNDHTHSRLHENRVVHIDDKPSWVMQDTKEKIRDYHLHRLGATLSRYKEKFTKH